MENETPATAPDTEGKTEEPARKPFRLSMENAEQALGRLLGLERQIQFEETHLKFYGYHSSKNAGEYNASVAERNELHADILEHVRMLVGFHDAIMALASKVPETPADALAQLHMAKEEANTAARACADAQRAWAALDLVSARIREECVQELVAGFPEKQIPGVAPTRAQTAASSHPRYTRHRDMVDKAAEVKRTAEVYLECAQRNFVAAEKSAELMGVLTRTAQVAIVGLAAAPAQRSSSSGSGGTSQPH